MNNQHPMNKTFLKFYVEWKDDPKEEAYWERKVDFRRDYPNFVIEDNDF